MWSAQFLAANATLSSPIIAGSVFPPFMAYAVIASPLLEYGLIRFVSGVPLLEVIPFRERFFGRSMIKHILSCCRLQETRNLGMNQNGLSTRSSSCCLHQASFPP